MNLSSTGRVLYQGYYFNRVYSGRRLMIICIHCVEFHVLFNLLISAVIAALYSAANALYSATNQMVIVPHILVDVYISPVHVDVHMSIIVRNCLVLWESILLQLCVIKFLLLLVHFLCFAMNIVQTLT